ncbi:MAG: glycosyltransferase family 4 protein [Ignavibacteriaceae bacterium]
MRKSILFIDEDPGRAGSTVSLEYLVKGFSERNYSVKVLTSKKDEKTKSRIKKYAQIFELKSDTLAVNFHFTNKLSPLSLSGLHSIWNDFTKFVKGLFIFARYLKVIKPDLVYLNEYSVIQASIASYFMNIPSVVHIRSMLINGLWGIRRFIISNLIFIFNKRIFAITDVEAKQLNPNIKQVEKIYVVPEFFQLSESSDLARKIRAFDLPGDKTIITMLGGILDIKGSIVFLKAAIELSTKNLNVVFVLAGKNYVQGKEALAYYNQCLDLISTLKKTNSLIHLGEIVNPLELIEQSDIIVSASTETHFSRPVIEAWGFGKPVVVAETEHAQNLITDDEDGLLYPAFDHHALANNLIKLIKSKEIRDKFGNNGRCKVIEKFDAEKNIDVIIKQCDSLLLKYK